MRRLLLASVIALVLAHDASANPISRAYHYMGHHKRFFIMEGVAVGAASLHAYGLHRCRHTNGVEACDSHYGAAWGFYGFLTGMNVIAAPALAESCWKGGQGKFCYALGYSGSIYQGAWGLHEATINRPREHEHNIKPSAPTPSLLTLRF